MTSYRGERESVKGFRGRKLREKKKKAKKKGTRNRGAIDGVEMEVWLGGVGRQKWRIGGKDWPYMEKSRDFSLNAAFFFLSFF